MTLSATVGAGVVLLSFIRLGDDFDVEEVEDNVAEFRAGPWLCSSSLSLPLPSIAVTTTGCLPCCGGPRDKLGSSV